MPNTALRFPPGKSGGLIEAAVSARPMAQHVGFRRVNPAASLKRADRHQRCQRRRGSFRRVNPAASLKLLVDNRLVDNRLVFPPGKSGGLIEARHRWLKIVRSGVCFRRVNPAASLKRAFPTGSWPSRHRVSAG